jgi:CheY-like chemotaxis protein
MMNIGWEGAMPRLLIAEADTININLLERTLTNQGFSIAGIASSGEQAIELALQSRPDLMLTNVNLDGAIDGVGAAQVIGAFLKIPVIFLSATHQPEVVDKIKVAYPASYIAKPFSPEELYANIMLAISFRSAVNEKMGVDWAKVKMLVNISITKRSVAGIMKPDGKLLYANTLSQIALFQGKPRYGEYAFQNISFYDAVGRRQIMSPISDIFNDAMVFGIMKPCVIQFVTGKPWVCNVVAERISDIHGSTVAVAFDIVSSDNEI